MLRGVTLTTKNRLLWLETIEQKYRQASEEKIYLDSPYKDTKLILS